MKNGILLTATLAASILSSCSLFEKSVKPEAFLPSDRETIKNEEQLKPYYSSKLAKGDFTGDWVVESVDGIKPQGEEVAFIRFDNSTKQIFGNNGCNSINGTYNVNAADSTLSFGNLITTMRYCPIDDNSDVKIVNALNNSARFISQATDSLYTITIFNNQGAPLMTLAHQDYDFLNGTWAVKEIGGKPQTNPDMKLVFDMNESRLHGNTGCNILNGSIVVDMSSPNSLSFQQIATTRRMCPDFDNETALTVGLENTVFVRPVNKNTLELLDNSHKVIMRLARTEA